MQQVKEEIKETKRRMKTIRVKILRSILSVSNKRYIKRNKKCKEKEEWNGRTTDKGEGTTQIL